MAPNKNNKSKHKSNKTFFFAIGIIAIMLVGIGAYVVLGRSNQPGNVLPTPTPTPAPTTFNGTPTPNPSPTTSPTGETDPLYVGGTKVLLQTSVGNITLEMRNDKPITTTNFVNLVNKGIYAGTIFHRVIAGFMIQGGQNSSANVATIPDEIGNNNHNLPYTVAMAKTSDPNSATSQFFINVANNGVNSGPTFDSTYTVFGKVIAGQSVVDAIANAPVTSNAYEANSTPINPVTVLKATVIP